MRAIFPLFFAFFLCCGTASYAVERTGYVSVLPDIPIPAGLTEDADKAMVFDKASGKVVTATLTGLQSDEKQVMGFYLEALPQLGWTPMKTGVFVRNGEQLLVKTRKVRGGVALELSLVPKRK